MFRGQQQLRFYTIYQTYDAKSQLTIVYMILEKVSNDETLLYDLGSSGVFFRFFRSDFLCVRRGYLVLKPPAIVVGRPTGIMQFPQLALYIVMTRHTAIYDQRINRQQILCSKNIVNKVVVQQQCVVGLFHSFVPAMP
jgi:hypothetical protein